MDRLWMQEGRAANVWLVMQIRWSRIRPRRVRIDGWKRARVVVRVERMVLLKHWEIGGCGVPLEVVRLELGTVSVALYGFLVFGHRVRKNEADGGRCRRLD